MGAVEYDGEDDLANTSFRYWAAGDGMTFTHTAPESDVEALLERFVTVTPLSYVLNDESRMELWRDRLQE